MANKNVMEEVSVEQLINKYNLIIPEIQREYVWGNNDYEILDKFFSDIKEGVNKKGKGTNASDETETFKKMLELANDADKDLIIGLMNKALNGKDLNIGFIYSYRPDYYVYNDLNEDVYLIDGQQRFTTLFLALFYFSLKENKQSDFKNLFRFDAKLERIAFDYRVRSLTHNFLIELVANCNSIDDLKNIHKKTWYLSDFASDVTINAIVGVEKNTPNKKEVVGTLKKLETFFSGDETKYYDFIKKQIKFWHFKTEETSQGEELYITMNSRGQQLADNETLRAKLFEDESVKGNQIEWGKDWEEWQDFFWKNRDKSSDVSNADFGFNQFFKWVAIIECIKNEEFKTLLEAEKRYKELREGNQIPSYVKLPTIKKYFIALNSLNEQFEKDYFNQNCFSSNYNSDWLSKPISQIHLMKLLPALLYLQADKPIVELNRFLRFFSNMCKDVDIAKNPDSYIIQSIQLTLKYINFDFKDIAEIVALKNEFSKLITKEEEYKLLLYKNPPNKTNRNELEQAFWVAEDNKNCSGKIGHLLELAFHQEEYQKFSFQSPSLWEGNFKFEIDKFTSIYNSYIELSDNVYEVWGDLLPTDMYVEQNDRVIEGRFYPKNINFLRLVLNRTENKGISLLEFAISLEKQFIAKYNMNKEEIRNELSSKNQLYFYYILHNRILKSWQWNDKWNFGAYDGANYPKYKSVFDNGKIYQFYGSQWRYNMGYDSSSGIIVQNNFDEKRDYIQEVIDWAK